MIWDKLYAVLKILSVFLAPCWLAIIIKAIVPDIELSFWELYLNIAFAIITVPMAVSLFWMTPTDLDKD